jgi:hypothetical protein
MRIRMTVVTSPDADEQTAIRGIKALIKRLWRNHKMKLLHITAETDEPKKSK